MNRGLVLSGGGSHGAFQVGALRYLMETKQREYSSYFGISVGALNSAFLAMHPSDKPQDSFDELEKLWFGIDNSKVRKHWIPFGPVHALWKQSYYNSKPLQKMVHERLDKSKIKQSGNKLKVGAVALETGEYKLFDQDYPNLQDAVLASSAFPGMLIPVELEGKTWIDGGVREVTPLKHAIDDGADEIDVIMTASKDIPKDFSDYKTIKIGLRSISILMDEVIDGDIRTARLINKLVKAGVSKKRRIKINIFRPEEKLKMNSLDFDPDGIRKEMDYGYELALNQGIK